MALQCLVTEILSPSLLKEDQEKEKAQEEGRTSYDTK
jgi:hypothetical protein